MRFDQEKLQAVYEQAKRRQQEKEAIEAQQWKCHTGTCEHDRFFKDGRLAKTRSGENDWRGTCRESGPLYNQLIERQYDNMIMDVADFLEEMLEDDAPDLAL